VTRQDWVCWFWVLDGETPEFAYALRHTSRESDERDFELMRFAQSISSCGPAAIELYGIPCRGWTVGILSPQRFAELFKGLT